MLSIDFAKSDVEFVNQLNTFYNSMPNKSGTYVTFVDPNTHLTYAGFIHRFSEPWAIMFAVSFAEVDKHRIIIRQRHNGRWGSFVGIS